MKAVFFEGEIEDNYIDKILNEIYRDRVYEKIFAGRNNLTVLDIGANIGLTAMYFSKYAKDVYSVEPSKEHFGALTKMLEFNQITNVHPVNAALYIKDGEFPLIHPGNRTMFSLHTNLLPIKIGEEVVKAITLPELFDQFKIEHVDFMKLDVEGSEQEILGSIGFTEVAPKIDQILAELHDWSGRNPNQAKEALKNRGYRVESIPNDANLILASRV